MVLIRSRFVCGTFLFRLVFAMYSAICIAVLLNTVVFTCRLLGLLHARECGRWFLLSLWQYVMYSLMWKIIYCHFMISLAISVDSCLEITIFKCVAFKTLILLLEKHTCHKMSRLDVCIIHNILLQKYTYFSSQIN